MENSIIAELPEDVYAQILFDFEHEDDCLEQCDFCIAFGSHDPNVAIRAAQVYMEGLTARILFTGGLGRITSKTQGMTEAALYREIALQQGVPASAILIEDQSTNTGENIRFTQELLEKTGHAKQRHIFVERPYREVRTRATLKAQWSQLDYLMTSPKLTYQDYCHFYENNGPISKSDFIALMVGDLQRIIVYPSLGYQTEVSIPHRVTEAYEALVDMGFVSQMLRDDTL